MSERQIASQSDIDLVRHGEEYRAAVREGDVSLGTAVVLAVAAVRDEDPFRLTPALSEVIDTDALETIFEQGPHAVTDVTFRAWDCLVTIESPSSIRIEPTSS